MTALWPDAFVEEANLTFQISTLRKALGEDGASWIQTLPKHGYRFAADVKAIPMAEGPASAAGGLEVSAAGPTAIGAAVSGGKWLAAFIAVPLLAAALYLALSRFQTPEPVRPLPAAALPLTTYPGFEMAPSLSPDGSLVAFVWDGPSQKNFDIYVKVVGPGEPIPVTKDPARDDNPVFSPDGRLIAFERFTWEASGPRGTADLYVVPALGGAERRVAADLRAYSQIGTGTTPGMAWTPDGRWLAHWSRAEDPGIWLFAVEGSDRRRISEDGAGPAFSEDGRHMAFIRPAGAGVAVYVLPLTDGFMPAGPPRQVSPESPAIRTVAWLPGNRGLIFSSSGHQGLSRLQTIALASNRLEASGPPELLPAGENGTDFSLSRAGRLVYSAHFEDTNIWRLSLTGPDRLRSEPLVRSTFHDYLPDYSPDGTRIAFTSTRSGAEEIWVANADGSKPDQMTTMRGWVCANPRWSPNGESILFHSASKGSPRELYVLNIRSREVKQLTDDPAADTQASWSRDGRTVYFASNKTGSNEIWRMPATGGDRTQVTRHGGAFALESYDGRFLYYSKAGNPRADIWRVPVDGGEEQLIVKGLRTALSFAVAKDGLFFVRSQALLGPASIDFFEFKTGTTRTVIALDKPPGDAMAVSPTGQYLLYSVYERLGSDLMLVEKFQ
jgi:Tol biopolymer transport system component